MDWNQNFSTIIIWMVNLNENWDFSKILIKIEIFYNCYTNGDFRKAVIKMNIFNGAVQNQDLSRILS